MWILPWIKLSWHSGSTWGKLGWLNWLWQFLCDGFYYFDPKGFYYSYAWSCSLCEGRTSFCTGLISGKLYGFLLLFWLALLHSVSCFYFLYRSSPLSLCTVFDSVSSNIDEVLSINSTANVFVFGDFSVHHKDWLIYSGGTSRPGGLCYNFCISNDLTQIVNFPTRTPDCDSQSCSFGFISVFIWIYLDLLMLLFVLQWLSLHWEVLIMLLSQFPFTYPQT